MVIATKLLIELGDKLFCFFVCIHFMLFSGDDLEIMHVDYFKPFILF
jgi:hypothetical protein